MPQDSISILKELNFSEYEAKAYLALLENSPSTGYAVALNSGIPRSKIYEVLGTLKARGDIVVTHDEKPLYAPIPPKELLAGRKKRSEAVFHEAEKTLERYTQSSENRESIWNITGQEAIFHRIRETMKGAKRRIMLELWEEDALELEEALRQEAARGIEIIIMVYGNLDFDFAKICRHDLSDDVIMHDGGRWLLYSMDDEEIVAGIVSLKENSRAAWTTHPALVIPITEFIIHDWYIMTVMKEFRPIIEERFGPKLEDLRKQFGIRSHKALDFM